MARPKKPKYEYVERLKLYRKRVKDADGKYVAIYGKTPDELTEKLQAVAAAIEEGQIQKENPLVKDYAANWLRLITADMKAKNREIYQGAINLHVLPIIGNKRMREVQPDDVKLVMVALADKSASLQSKVLNTMRKMFENAVDNDLLTKNPCAKLKSGGYKAKEKTALTEDQVQTLLQAVKGTRAEPFIMLGIYTGMRREEILGLQWDCVKLGKNTPHVIVKRALRWENCRPVVNEILKSDAAQRTIPIPPQLADYLKEIQQPAGHVVGGEPLTQTQFKNLWRVVENRRIGEKTYVIPHSLTREKSTFTREMGAKSRGGNFYYTIDFPVSPHILRHTYITNLILSGADLKTVQYLAGHANIKITLDIYTHLVDRSPDKLISEVSKAFEVKSEVK